MIGPGNVMSPGWAALWIAASMAAAASVLSVLAVLLIAAAIYRGRRRVVWRDWRRGQSAAVAYPMAKRRVVDAMHTGKEW